MYDMSFIINYSQDHVIALPTALIARLQLAKQQIATGQLIEIEHVDDLDKLLT